MFWSVVLAVLFTVWWIVSVANQFHRGAPTRAIRRHIPFGLIPGWTFFAPNPACTDARLIAKFECAGQWTEWAEVYNGYGPWWRRWIAHPELVRNKAVADMVNALMSTASRDPDDRTVVLTAAYLALLGAVIAHLGGEQQTAVRFAIVRTAQSAVGRNSEIAFVSEVHRLSPDHDRVH